MKKFLFPVLLAIAATFASQAQNIIYPYSDGGLWGYKTSDGKIAVEAEYSEVSLPAGPYGLVGKSDGSRTKWGVVEASGNMVIPVQYDYIDLCNEDFVAVYNGPVDNESKIMTSGKWGYIKLSDPNTSISGFSIAGPFIDSVAWVNVASTDIKRQRRTMPIVDKKGKVIGEDIIFGVTGTFNIEDMICPHEDGSYPLNDGQWILIGTNLQPITDIHDTYQMVGAFEDGLAWVKKNGKFGFINRKGEEVIPPIYTTVQDAPDAMPVSLRLRPESGAIRWVMNGNGEIAWMNEKGETVIDFIKSDGRIGILDIAEEQMWDF